MYIYICHNIIITILSYRSFQTYPIGIETQQVGARKPGFGTSKGSIVKRTKQEEKQVQFSNRLDIVLRTVIERNNIKTHCK